MNTRPIKVILSILAVLVILGAAGALANTVIRNADAKIAAAEERVKMLQKERDEAKAAQVAAEKREADEKVAASSWQQKAQAQRKRADAAEARVRALEDQIAQAGPIHEPTDPSTLPAAAKPIAEEFTKAGVKAEAEGTKVAMEEPAAQKALGLVRDGLRYPQVVAIAHLQADEIAALKGQKAGLQGAYDDLTIAKAHSDGALKECDDAKAQLKTQLDGADGQIATLKGEVKAQKTKLRAETVKKWVWGGTGAGVTALIVLLF